MQNRKSVAHSFIEALRRRGIDQVFANSGTDHAPIVEALSEMQSAGIATPDFHVIPHENLAMAMAQGYYRAKGKPAVVLVHVTIGTANTVCSLMNARRANVPVLLIAGKNPLSQEGHVGSRSVPIHWGQDAFDQNALVRDYTKWEHELRAYQNIDALIDRALTIAMSEPRGPVYLTLPRELLGDADPTEPGAITPEAVPAEPDGDAIAALADMLAASEKPAIITSTIGVDRESRLLLETIAEDHAVPVLQSWPYAVNIRSAHPMNMRMQYAEWLEAADFILVIDAAVPWVPRRCKPKRDATIVHLSADPSYAMYPYRDFPASQLITGSSRAGLQGLNEALQHVAVDEKKIARRRQQVADIVQQAAKERAALRASAENDEPISAVWITACINQVRPNDAVILNELAVPFNHHEFTGDEIYVGETTAGGLGTAIGAGLGAKLADPQRMVICCVGDGSYMFSNPTAALLVSQALGLPVLIIITNNAMWYAVEHSTIDIYPGGATASSEGAPLTKFGASPNYAMMAEACGAHGETVTDPGKLADALERGFECNRNGQTAVIDVITAPGSRIV
jgi:acetolactate synthase-1/2/3 large subunit